MSDTVTYYRDKFSHGVYRYLLKPIFFQNDPEQVHDYMTRVGVALGRHRLGRLATRELFDYRNPKLEQDILGVHFDNPVGLSAGFDKNGQLTSILSSVGFGFAEVGSVTGEPCAGNPKPRLWRLPGSQSLAVYYGLKNDGCEVVAKRLQTNLLSLPVGVSVAMTNCADNLIIKNAVRDYAKAFRTVEPVAAYITINVSCPNTQGGQPFVSPHKLDYLLDILDEIPTTKPIFIKLSPDLSEPELDAVIGVLERHRVHGIICTNLTKKRDSSRLHDQQIPTKGGLSGKVVQELSDQTLAYLYRRVGKRFILVGCGGIFNAEDAYRKIRLGASLVQLITGMIYEGPQVISEINRGLVQLLKRDGFRNISEAVGVAIT